MAFATTSELAARLGITLSSAQESRADAALDAASAVVAAELDRVEDDIDPVPELVKQVTITVALRAYANPEGVSSEAKTLGAFQHSRGFRGGGGLELTGTERLLIRRAYFGSSSGSSRPESTSDEIWNYLYS